MKIIVLGGGWCGLTVALLLHRDGHEVTVLEKNPARPPGNDPWDAWERPGVTQFRMPHIALPRTHALLVQELPDVAAALRAAGGAEYSFLSAAPALFPPERRTSEDDRFTTVTARRPVLESVVAGIADHQLQVRRGTRATGLLPGAANGVPTVAGVRLATGEELAADLVIDATGRKSHVPEWLPEIGARPPRLDAEKDGFTYYGRFYRSRDGSTPESRGPVSMPYGSISVLTLPSDNDTWSVTVFVQSRDQQVKDVRHPDAFARVIGACLPQAHWLDGEPITGMIAMSGVMDQRLDYTSDDGAPVVNGLLAVGDAWAATNPSLGRGLSIGLMHAVRLRDLLRLGLDPGPLAKEWARVTAEEFLPWYRCTVATDRDRIAEIDAIREGRPVPPAQDPVAALRLAALMTKDAELFRALLDVTSVLALPEEALARPAVRARMAELGPLDRAAAPPLPGPNRAQLLALIAG